MKKWMRLLDILYPRRCPLCDALLLPAEEWLCADCGGKWPVFRGPRCKKCSQPLTDPTREYCSDCSRIPHAFDRCYAPYVYRGAVRESLMRFKYQGRQEYAVFYARSILAGGAAALSGMRPGLLIPVPVHPDRLRRRGYNQAALIARELARELRLPVREDLVRRVKRTRAQKELGAGERRKNLEHAFALTHGKEGTLAGKRILLVDDIYTTGSTADALASLLKKNGAAYVGCAAVATGLGET